MPEQITIHTPDGDMGVFLARPVGVPRASVVVVQEIFGINADMRQTCDWLASCGFAALCPDLFWRLEPGVDLTDATESEWRRGLSLYAAFDRDKGVEDIGSAMNVARALGVRTLPVGVMGFCLGGLMTYRVAALQGADAAVAYYGGATEQYASEAEGLESPLMLHLAGDDVYMPPPAQAAIRTALAGHSDVEIHSYAGCSHAFARRGGTHYDSSAATLANERTLRFFLEHLR
jgi:carboxymethylenebutenolidase